MRPSGLHRATGALALLCALVDCARPAASTARVTHPLRVASAPAAPSPGPARPVAIVVRAREVAAAVARLRGVAAADPVDVEVLDRAAIGRRLRQRAESYLPPGELVFRGAALARLGLLPADTDYAQTLFALNASQVAGFYDPRARRLVVADDVPPEALDALLVHESAHALQHRRFALFDAFAAWRPGEQDRLRALRAAIEGDATATELAWRGELVPLPATAGVAGAPRAGDRARAGIPPAVRDAARFSYDAGLALCRRLLAEGGGLAALDALLARPPESSEQVLHPERYLSRDAPIVVPPVVPWALRGDHVLAWHDVLGELVARQFLASRLDALRAARAAAGWGGDRAMLLVPRRHAGAPWGAAAMAGAVFVWALVLDRAAGADPDAEAVEFARAVARVMALGARGRRVHVPGALAAHGGAGGNVSLLVRRGRVVTYADGVPRARAEALVASLRARDPEAEG